MKSLDPLRCALLGTALIEASAGTGKTYTICTLFVRLVAQGAVDVRDILVVTFTEAATAELRGRIRTRLFTELDGLTRGDPSSSELTAHLLESDADQRALYASRLRAALEGFDQAAIFTIHGFCHRVLKEHAFECEVDFDAELVRDSGPMFEELLRDFWAREAYPLEPLLLRLIQPKDEPRALAKVLTAVSPRPWADVLPNECVRPDLSALKTFQEAWTDLRSRWHQDRAEVAVILGDTTNALKRNIYKVESVPKKLLEIDLYLASLEPSEISPKSCFLEKLTTESINGNSKAKSTPPAHVFFEACSRWHSAREALIRLGEDFVLYLRRRFVDTLRTDLFKKKEKLGIQFFDDLLGSVDRALRSERGDLLAKQIRDRYRAALIDEFQDTDFIQYRIFSNIYAGRPNPLLLIGDPKQAIYSFRGADIFAYLAAARDAPDPPTTLDVNWRSDPGLVDGVARLFRRAKHPFLLPEIELPQVRAKDDAVANLTLDDKPVPPLQFRFLTAQGRAGQSGQVTKTTAQEVLPALVANDIARLLASDHRLKGKAIEPSDIAVLVRSNQECERYQAELGRLGIPSVSSHTSSVFQSAEAEALALLVAAIAEPSNSRRVRAALGTRLMGLSAKQISDLDVDEAAWDSWASRFRAWHELWQGRGFIQMHRAILASGHAPGAPAVSTRLLGQSGGERSLTNHLHLAELLHRAAHTAHLGLQGLCRWFERARGESPRADDAAELRLETDDAAVKLVTIHKSKGLEYPVVYCPSLWHAAVWSPKRPRYDDPVLAFHDPSEQDRLKLDLRNDPGSRARSDFEQRAEALRLTYVALTRAKYLVVVVTGALEGLADSALGHLLHNQASQTDAWAATLEHIDNLDSNARWSENLELAEASDGSIRVDAFDESLAPPYESSGAPTGPLQSRPRARTVVMKQAISSYSALIRGAPEADVRGGATIDQGETEVELSSTGQDEDVSPSLTTLVPLRDFPRTSTAGSCFHAIYEELDFKDPDPRALPKLIHAKLELYGYDSARWSEVVNDALAGVLETPLESGANALRLFDLARSQRMDELPFMISVARGAQQDPARELTAARLADVFEAHRGTKVPADYVDALRRLEFPNLRGFLKGYIDLVFEHDGRFFVVDYKSNYLGAQFVDYVPDQLSRGMSHGHYFLQYHLYVVALHRYLKLRQLDYRYERHFGGVYYLFIKGMAPETGHRSGVFFDRPSLELVEGLDALFGRPDEGWGRS